MNPEARIDGWLSDRREMLVELLTQLVEQRTENPPGNESDAAEVVRHFFDAHGIAHKSFEAVPGRANIIGEVGGGGKRLFVAGHLDTVPAGDGWTLPPFKATIKDGRLYARGASDDKGPLAGTLLTALCLKECFDLGGTFLAAAVADEECGSALGLEFLLREGHVQADCAIIPDSAGNMRTIEVGEKGMLRVEIVSHGKQAHGSRPDQGVNAIWNLIALLEKFRERGLPQMEHALFSPPTHNLGVIQGGAAPNIVPGRARAEVDIRWLPGQTEEQFLQLFRDAIRETEADIPEARFELTTGVAMRPSEVAHDAPIVDLIRRKTRAVLGLSPELVCIGGITVAKQLNEHGIPAVAWSPGEEGIAHMADEWVDIDELLDFARILARIAVDLLGMRS